MTFRPPVGYWSRENFSESGNAYATNPDLQGIEGGFLTLKPAFHTSTPFMQGWVPVTGWAVQNTLSHTGAIQQHFSIIAGAADPSFQMGFQGPVSRAGAWQFSTPEPVSGTGVCWEAISLSSGSPYTGFYAAELLGQPFTFEVEVSSLYDLYNDPLPGYTGSAQSGLSPLSGVINHGIYLETDQFWEFLELNPGGIRLLNHPECALPVDLSVPTKLRVAVDANNLYLLTEHGGLAAMGKFDTAVLDVPGVASPRLLFGAPVPNYGCVAGISGSAGHSLWHAFRFVPNKVAIDFPDNLDLQVYPLATQTYYTEPWDPTVPIAGYLGASIGFLPYQGGTTVVTAQRSGLAGWLDLRSANLTGSSPVFLDLSDILPQNTPANHPTSNLEVHPSNAIRFKVAQTSTDGRALPPALDYIEMRTRQEDTILDLLPNWKPKTHAMRIQFAVRSGEHKGIPPHADPYTTFLYMAAASSGDAAGGYLEQGLYSLSGNYVGTGEYVADGPFRQAYQTFKLATLTPQTGTQLAQVFGTSPIESLFPNPNLEGNYTPVEILPRYVTGSLDGELAPDLQLPPGYTGGGYMKLSKQNLIKPWESATRDFLNQFMGTEGSALLDYAQQVIIQGPVSDVVGIEAMIPSGNMASTMLFGCDLQISEGSRLEVYATGAGISSALSVDAGSFREFTRLGMVVSTTGSGAPRFGFRIPTGLDETVSFAVDNITLEPVGASYLSMTGVPDLLHSAGTVNIIASQPNVERSATVCNAMFLMDAYTTGVQATVFSKYRGDGKGIALTVDAGGYPIATFDMYARDWAGTAGVTPAEISLGQFSITGSKTVPLGMWSHLGFCHELELYPYFGATNFSGQVFAGNFAAANRALLTLNGEPIGSLDLMRNWTGYGPAGDRTPFASYVVTGSGTVAVGLGLFGLVDSVQYTRPPIADGEVQLAIRGARANPPYFLPDVMLHPNTTGAGSNILGNNVLSIGDIYSLFGPGDTCWDHGELKNHLSFTTGVQKFVNDSPYTNNAQLGCTHFGPNDYGVAGYSSAFDRLFNNVANLPANCYKYSNDGISLGTWIKPDGAGCFVEVVRDGTAPAQDALVLGIDTGMHPFFGRRLADGTYSWQVAAPTPVATGEWVHIAGQTLLAAGWNTSGDTCTYSSAVLVSGQYVNTALNFNVANAGFHYYGRAGDTVSSATYLGRSGSCSMVDAFLSFNGPLDISPVDFATAASRTAHKKGFGNVLMEGNRIFTGQVSFQSMDYGYFDLPKTSTTADRIFWVSSNGGYGNELNLVDGFALHDDNIFREVEGYYVRYDDAQFLAAVGDTISPIRIGDYVPDGAVNLARVDTPQFTVDSAVQTVDLSDWNPNNLATYRGGLYTVDAHGAVVPSSASGSFQGLNAASYVGQIDATFSGQVASSELRVTSVSAVSKDLAEPAELFYGYLIGRGRYAVQIDGAEPHPTGQLLETSTGSVPENYLANLDLLRKNLHLQTTDGKPVDVNSFPWDVMFSPFAVDSLSAATGSISVDGIGTSLTGALPQGLFTALLLTRDQMIPGQTLWIQYPAYDLETRTVDPLHREVVNTLPLMRERQSWETPQRGQYSLELSPDAAHQSYNLKIYGILSGYNGTI